MAGGTVTVWPAVTALGVVTGAAVGVRGQEIAEGATGRDDNGGSGCQDRRAQPPPPGAHRPVAAFPVRQRGGGQVRSVRAGQPSTGFAGLPGRAVWCVLPGGTVW